MMNTVRRFEDIGLFFGVGHVDSVEVPQVTEEANTVLCTEITAIVMMVAQQKGASMQTEQVFRRRVSVAELRVYLAR